ncbi:MAG: hypothetical protein DI547_11855 [Sphingobium sp.]|nr:MAG: hypothetical protein DI547_11855 [Sphingobium sp.]
MGRGEGEGAADGLILLPAGVERHRREGGGGRARWSGARGGPGVCGARLAGRGVGGRWRWAVGGAGFVGAQIFILVNDLDKAILVQRHAGQVAAMRGPVLLRQHIPKANKTRHGSPLPHGRL